MSIDIDVRLDHRYCHLDTTTDVDGGLRISLGATPAGSLNITLDTASAKELTDLLSTWLATQPRSHPTPPGTTDELARQSARTLARRLRRSGALRTPAWWEVVTYTPRHLFIPHRFVPRADDTWTQLDSTGTDLTTWLDTVYADTSHVTDLAENSGRPVAVVGDEPPSRILSMLEHLDIEDDHSIIEIGTGTGYSTALLHERVGGTHVQTIDTDAHRLQTARQRLDQADYAPVHTELVDSLDAIHGDADRLISHYAVPAIPRSWILPLEGILVTEFAPLGSPGHAVVLHCSGDTAEGHFASTITPATQPFHQASPADIPETTPVIESPYPPPWFLVSHLPRRDTTPGDVDRFGLTVTPDEHIIWRDDPRGPYHWRLLR